MKYSTIPALRAEKYKCEISLFFGHMFFPDATSDSQWRQWELNVGCPGDIALS